MDLHELLEKLKFREPVVTINFPINDWMEIDTIDEDEGIILSKN